MPERGVVDFEHPAGCAIAHRTGPRCVVVFEHTVIEGGQSTLDVEHAAVDVAGSGRLAVAEGQIIERQVTASRHLGETELWRRRQCAARERGVVAVDGDDTGHRRQPIGAKADVVDLGEGVGAGGELDDVGTAAGRAVRMGCRIVVGIDDGLDQGTLAIGGDVGVERGHGDHRTGTVLWWRQRTGIQVEGAEIPDGKPLRWGRGSLRRRRQHG